MVSVNGIDCDSANLKISTFPRYFKNTKDEKARAAIISATIDRAVEITPSTPSVSRLNVEPIYMKNIGTKNPKPKDEIL